MENVRHQGVIKLKDLQDIFPQEHEIPAEFALGDLVEQKEYLINGEIKHWDGPVRDVLSPVCIKNGDDIVPKRIGSYPLLGENEAREALKAAVGAYAHGTGQWPTMGVEDRIKHMECFVRRMKEQKSQIVKLLMWEIGKSYQDSIKEFDRTVAYINDTIKAVKDLDRNSSRFAIEQGIIGQIKRAPMGVVLCMGPYNYPLNETFTTLIPALIMGNPVIFKPPKSGVLVHRPLLEAFRDCFPPGVVNTVYGDGETVITPIIASGDINVLAFIGSSKVAGILKSKHPRPHRLRSCLGLEAKNPAIILPGADLELTVQECILGSLSYNGQRCTALKMIFVHSDIAEAFLEKFTQTIDKLVIGMPWAKDVFVTPLPERDKPDYLAGLVDDAVHHGARVVNENGGALYHSFFYPAVLFPVNDQMKVYYEEQFGPVIPVAQFSDLEVPLNYIIESNYGQQVSIFGTDPDQIARLIDPITNQVCRVNINSQCQRGPDTFPFTGRKDSAEETLSVSDALRVFSIRTLVAAKEGDLNEQIITEIVRERKSNFLSTDFIF